MSTFGYIHVSLHGHFDNKLSVPFTFNPGGAGKLRWEASLPDPEAIISNFMSARECYVMWQNEVGRYFAVITNDLLDARAGRVMVTVMVDNGCAVNGRAVFTALSGLKKAFLEDRTMTDEAVRQVLISTGIPEQPLHLASWRHEDAGIPEASVRPLCYRTYLSTRELETVFSFPNQPEYSRFRYTVVITATASLRPGLNVERLTAPVKKQYTVICPEGVSATKEIVSDGDRMTLTFTKEGYNSRKETITIGTPSPYVRTDGSALVVKTPAESGMGFTRKVRVAVRSAKGGLINGYTMTVNDRPVNTMEPFIELSEQDLTPGRKVEIQVASNNFNPLKAEYLPEELPAEGSLELVLVPIEQGITLRLDFGEGRVFEQQISIEKNTPEYSQLHSGNFHGFRAHRLANPSYGEVYNVDVRSSTKPVAPEFANVSTAGDRGAARHRVVPQFERVTPAAKTVTEKDKARMTLAEKPVKDTATTVDKPDTKKKQGDKSDGDNERASLMLKLICLGACIVAIVLAAIFIIPPLIKPADGQRADMEQQAESQPVEAPVVAAEPTPAAAAAPAPAAPSGDVKADYDYFNANRAWRRDNLRSDEGRKLYDAIVAGDIDAMAASDYFAIEGQCTNKDAANVIDLVWASKGTPNQHSNVRALKRAEKSGSINMWSLFEDLSRAKPATPNTDPRPRR